MITKVLGVNSASALADSCQSEGPLLSVTVIAYHHGPFISRCLDSLLAQRTNFPIEILVGDDCSNDGTKEIVERYQRENPGKVRAFVNDQNLGPARNSENLRSFVRGKYYLGFEGDDFLICDTFFQSAVDYLEAHTDIAAVCGGTVSVDPEGLNPRKSQARFQLGRNYSLNDYLKFGYTIHGNTMVRRWSAFDVNSPKYKNLRASAPHMGDVISKCLTYNAGDVYVLPAYVHAHRSGAMTPSSFSFQQASKTIHYTDMYLQITNALENYFGDGRSYRDLYLNRVAEVTLGVVLGNKAVSCSDWREYLKGLSIADRLRVITKVLAKLSLKLRRRVESLFVRETLSV